MKYLARHLISLFGLFTYMILGLASLSKATEPCESRPVHIGKKFVDAVVYEEGSIGTPVTGAKVQFTIRDFNPTFDPIYAECDFTTGVMLQSNFTRTTNEFGVIDEIDTPVYEHKTSKDYTEITIYVTAANYEPYRETKVLYYDKNSAYFVVYMINKTNQP